MRLPAVSAPGSVVCASVTTHTTAPHADHIRCVYLDAFRVPTCTAACTLPSLPPFFDSAMLEGVPLLKYD